MEISELIENTKLMEQNHADLIETLNQAGFTQVTTSTPLSEIVEYMKWMGGLRDIRLATVNKTTGKQVFYTKDEWDALGSNTRNNHIRIGLCIRAECKEFIIAKEDVANDTGGYGHKWADEYTDVIGLPNYVGSGAMFDSFDSKGNTDKILAHASNSGIAHPAAFKARGYKAASRADGGYDDPTEWSLPSFGILHLMYKYQYEINEALTEFFGTSYRFASEYYWSSDEYSSSIAWFIYFYFGFVYTDLAKTGTTRVRAVASVSAI